MKLLASIAIVVASAVAPAMAQPPARLTFSEAVKQFDPATQHLIWVLPPGMTASGPFEASVNLQGDGTTVFETTIALTADRPAGGSRPEYPADSEILRLAASTGYAKHIEDIRLEMDALTRNYPPGHRELNISSRLRTKIDDAHRKTYCDDNRIPPIVIYLEHGKDGALLKVSVDDVEPMLQQSLIKDACDTLRPPG